MEHLYVQLPDGTQRDFGPEKAKVAKSMPQVTRDIFITSLIVAEMTSKVGAGNVGEFDLRYIIREG